jgi:L-lactate utilization protein LutB
MSLSQNGRQQMYATGLNRTINQRASPFVACTCTLCTCSCPPSIKASRAVTLK